MTKPRRTKEGFVVARDPAAELEKLRQIFSASKASQTSALEQNFREARERAEGFAERDLQAALEA